MDVTKKRGGGKSDAVNVNNQTNTEKPSDGIGLSKY